MTMTVDEYNKLTFDTYFEFCKDNESAQEQHNEHVQALEEAIALIDKVCNETTAGFLVENPLNEAKGNIEGLIELFESKIASL